jgi:signal transduction histidine kinase
MNLRAPLPIEQSWLAHVEQLHGSREGVTLKTGPALALGEDRHPMLLWLQAVSTPEYDRWLLGIAKDQKTLMDFMGDLRLHLDAVMLLTYVLITLMGYYAMRSIGRTYERRLESQVRKRTQELEAVHEAMLSKTRLATIGHTASVLTHEMRNPLASIKLALSGLNGSNTLQSRERRRVKLVLGEVDRLDTLLSETLDYVRPVKVAVEPVDMERLLNRVLSEQEPLMAEKGIRIRREICAECASIRLDEAKMHQVLLNLLKNAVEASPEGGEIRVRLWRDGEELVLRITNGGEPIAPQSLERAFEPFYTTKPKGSGLGLGLVKRVIEEHGGRVELASDASVGTRVTLTLPDISG